MKRFSLKLLLKLLITCVTTKSSILIAGISNISRTSRLLLIITTFLQLAGLVGKSQSTLEIFLPAKTQSAKTFTFTRINPISGIGITDTFIGKGSGIFGLKVLNINLPGVGTISNGNQDLRKIFLAPGIPLNISINTNDTAKNKIPVETSTNLKATNKNPVGIITNVGVIKTDQPAENEVIIGAWRETDSMFRTMNSEMNEVYMFADPGSEAPKTLKDYDSILRLIDTRITFQQRPLKDFLLYSLMRQAIDSSDQILMLNNHKMVYLSYLNQLAYGSFKNDIDRRYNYKLNMLTSAQAGKPAPVFKLRDTTGTIHSLEDFKGKVVYVDLWASWCLPCRLETPYMHNIINMYGKRSDIAFIGISVGDRLQNWKRAIRQDKPRWLQLHDYNTFVANAYAASSVPRYILIDKEGNVVEFNAPPPSEQSKLILMIDKALSDSDKR